MTFRVGQKVVCVDDSAGEFSYLFSDPDRLVLNKIYEIERIYDDQLGYSLVALIGVSLNCYPKNGWRSSRFHPLVERKTDISVFTKMLTPTGVEA